MPRRDPQIELLLFSLDQAFGRRGWHGPTLTGAIRGVSAAEALWRAAPGRNTIWELVLHTAFWKHTVRERLTGERTRFPGSPRNFPEQPAEPDGARWQADIELLRTAHRELVATVERFSAARLHRKIPGTRYVPVEQIAGIAAHDVYHAGQISLLRRLRP